MNELNALNEMYQELPVMEGPLNETCFVIRDLDEHVSDISRNYVGLNFSGIDRDMFKYLDREVHFDGFMQQPVAIYEGKALSAKVCKFFSIEDAVSTLRKLKRTGAKVFAYMLIFHPNYYISYEMDPETHTHVRLDNPRLALDVPFWKLRFAVIHPTKEETAKDEQ